MSNQKVIINQKTHSLTWTEYFSGESPMGRHRTSAFCEAQKEKYMSNNYFTFLLDFESFK